jgi:hypothetical protein
VKRTLFGLALVALVIGLSAGKSHALREGWIVTKATQKELGLTYDLLAEKVGDVVLVSMEIPKDGKLKELESASFSMSEGSRTPLYVPMAMTEKKGVVSLRFQVGTEHVEKCSVGLYLKMHGRSGEFYAVMLKDYVTERKR